MKRLLFAAIALAVLTAPMVAGAKPPDGSGHGHGEEGGPPGLAKKPYGMPPGQAKKMWRRGERMPSTYYRSSRYYIEPVRYHLRRPPRGYRWVLVDDRAYLVRTDSGLIEEVVAALLR